ncbi:Asparaginyl-tRNA synthetase [Tribonema minus]|uniref:asparagine--tRNA ligase n=1 Tax=Tribonema minus TaxID=303371 RepID=A0A835YW11_9STRA|nr:Asparaginyl-tRNA synthetase [Tribonema minus]
MPPSQKGPVPLLGAGLQFELLSALDSKDFRVRKILVAARAAGIPVALKTCSAEAIGEQAPAAKALALRITRPTSAHPSYITQSNAIVRTLIDASETSGLYGDTEFARSQVDSWLELCWLELETPLAVLQQAKGHGDVIAEAKKLILHALTAVNAALAARTYLVGNRLTAADIALACAAQPILGAAASVLSGKDLATLPHAARWYMTVTHHAAFATGTSSSRGGGGGGGAAARAGVSAAALAAANSTVDAAFYQASAVHTDKPLSMVAPAKYRRRRVRVKELLARGAAAAGETVVVRGWLKTARSGAKDTLLFLVVNDGSCHSSLQVVASRDGTEGFAAAASCGGVGACVAVEGPIIESPAKGQVIEMQAKKVEVLGPVYQSDGSIGAADYPLAKKAHSLEYLRTHAHLRPRTMVYSAVMRVRNAMAYATHRFFNERGFVYVHTPLLTGADCEGAGEQFVVTTLLPAAAEGHACGGRVELPRLADGSIDYTKDFFSKRACLTVSGQLNVETYCSAMSDVYTFGPTFRAENSHTSRHLAEFWMIEPEIAFADLEDDMNLAEDYLKYLVAHALEHCDEDLTYFESKDCPGGEADLRARLRNVLENDFVRITYTRAVALLEEHIASGKVKFQNPVSWGVDLASEHERYITETVYKCPVVVTNYPKEIKAFYMKLDADGKTVSAMDILVPKIGEIIGGSQREESFDVLSQRAAAMGLEPAAISWYADLRRYGTMKHAGFGLGFERLILFITGIENIRDVIPFPRYPGHCEF